MSLPTLNPPQTGGPPVVGAAAEDLSRMEGEYGARMIGALKQMSVLIIGATGVGVETAKNLILAGPHTVVIHDDHPVHIRDLGTNFYLNSDMAAANAAAQDKKTAAAGVISRAAAIHSSLGELNPNVNVHIHSGPVTAADMHKFDVVAVTSNEFPLSQLIEWNNAARARHVNNAAGVSESKPTVFLSAAVTGVSAHVFADFGPKHLCFDNDGVAAKSIIIDHISQSQNGVVTIDGDRHLLNDGDWIKLEEVKGMRTGITTKTPSKTDMTDIAHDDSGDHTQTTATTTNEVVYDINGVFEIKTTKNPKRFLIGDTRGLSEYISGGVGTQIKKQTVFNHQTLSAQLYEPTFISGYMDFTKFGRDAQLHIARLALWAFQAKHNRLPAIHSADDANAVVAIAKDIVADHRTSTVIGGQFELDENVVQNVSLYAQCELPAHTALIGGVLAQEITKQTGKYSPITQFFHFDSFELLSAHVPPDATPLNTRYDHAIAVFGLAVQKKIQSSKTFLVGCGALGCEYIKLFALMGLGVNGGQIHITDDDRIELSNLSRQFLFRRKHVGQAKSTSAASAAVVINPDISPVLKALETRVEPKSEDVFDDKFWDSLDFVVNALDNATARKYTDSKCVLHHKALFESGTLGTFANSVLGIPFKTPSYSEGAVAGEEQGIAKCTLRNFPSNVVHCIEWAREKFDDLFVNGADMANSFIEDRGSFFAKLKQDPMNEADSLKTVRQWLKLSANPSIDVCVHLMIDEFYANYRNAINDLTYHFPADARNKEASTGVDLGPFWHGGKRFPQTISHWDPHNPLHLHYVFHGANILASVFGLKEVDSQTVAKIASRIKVPDWVYSGAKVNLDEEKKEATPTAATVSEEDHAVVERITAELSTISMASLHRLTPAEFEKDNDRNGHIDFITASTNLRAFNYHIVPADRNKCRLIAGKIIPAIATTTATITGFIGVEMYKYIMQKELQDFRATTLNLATNVFCCENLPDPVYKKSGKDLTTYMDIIAMPENHTVWDQIVIRRSGLTLQGVIDEIISLHPHCSIDIITTSNDVLLYSSLEMLRAGRKEILEGNLQRPFLDVYEELAGPVFPPSRNYIMLDCSLENEDGDTVFIPIIKYIFHE